MSFDFKNAPEKELKEKYKQIAAEIGDDQFFTKKELKHLPSVLMDGEQVLAFSSGLMDNNTWLIALTDKRIIFLDKGMIYGLKQTIIDLDKVNSISAETGLFFGSIAIEDGSSVKYIKNVWKKTVINFTNKVRDAIEQRKSQNHINKNTSSSDDVISQLERLMSLKEKGILTDQEFTDQKNKILS